MDLLTPLRRAFVYAVSLLALEPHAHALSSEELIRSRIDPSLSYRTRETPHFLVHYPAKLAETADRVARVSEEAFLKVTRFLGSEPDGKTHIVVTDQSDDASPYTFVFPQRQIFYDVQQPQYGKGLNQYVDWHDWLISHEFAHVVQLEMRGGLYRPLSTVLGSWFRPQLTTPPWLKEGLAVFIESRLTPLGRGGSSEYQMMVRVAHREGLLGDSKFVRKDTIQNFDNKDWPWGVRPYVMGYYLIETIAERSRAALPRMLRGHASSFPYFLGPGFRDAGFPEGFDEIWELTLARLKMRAERELAGIRKQPLTPIEFLSDEGHHYFGPVISPDGKSLLVTQDHPEYEVSLLKFGLEANGQWTPPERILTRATGYQTSYSRSGRFIALDMTSKSKRHYQISDLYIYDLKTSAFAAISPFLRARDPDIHPDGKHLVYVENDRGRNRLLTSDTAFENVSAVLGNVGYSRLTAPRISPDGKFVAVNVHNSLTGGEDIWVVGLGQDTLEIVMRDGARNLFPSWSPDGKELLFSSDRTGVANVYSLNLASRVLTRLSNVEGGFTFPVLHPKGEWVYGVSYRAHGYDVARFRLQDSLREIVGRVPASPLLKASAPPLNSREPAALRAETSAVSSYGGTKYLFPQYLAPNFVLRPGASQVGLTLGATDPLFFQHYSLDLRYDWATNLPVGSFYYFNGTRSTPIELTLSHDATPVQNAPEKLRNFSASLGLHFPLSPQGDYFAFKPYAMFRAQNFTGQSRHAGGGVKLVYDTQFTQIGYSFPESGSLLSADAKQLFPLGETPRSIALMEVAAKRHHPLPWPRHALHWDLTAATFLGPSDENNFYTVGGRSSFPYNLNSSYELYGSSPNALVTRKLALASFQYTFSLLDIQRGIGTSPFYFGRLSAGLRFQTAALPMESLIGPGWPMSVGAELYQSWVMGQLFAFTAQMGIYRGSSAIGGETQFLLGISSGK